MAGGVVVEFAFVFAVIGGLELLDRTNFALIGLAAKNPPRSVWAGAACAFLVTTALAVVIGAALVAAIGTKNVTYLRLGGGVVLLAYAAYLVLIPESERRPPEGRSAFATAFVLILLLEIADTTMIYTILFVAIIGNALLVGVAAAAALVAVAASAAVIGSRLGARVEPKLLERLVIGILVLAGILTILYALDPGLFPPVLG
jgi:putative Ca2+/H+ antiporter (TMEM165/GDT1 family)